MTELEKAARQALEALESCAEYRVGDPTYKRLAAALRRALEQPAIKQSLTTEQPALKAAPLSDYEKADADFHKWWYSHMKNDLMQPPLNGVGYRVARYIWDAALRQAFDHTEQHLEMVKQPAQPYKGMADHIYQATDGRMRIDPVTGDVGVGTPSEQPAQQCQHRIADARNLAVQSGYVCIDCGALFAAADHYEQPAQQELEHDEHAPNCSTEEFMLRGILASELKCWHRLTADEAQNLLAFVRNMPSKPAQQEPVACQYAQDVAMPEYRCAGKCQYTRPPAREPLTDEEIADAVGWNVEAGGKALPREIRIARAIEAKLREKNA